jgi:polysaccharide export outer membrane protein
MNPKVFALTLTLLAGIASARADGLKDARDIPPQPPAEYRVGPDDVVEIFVWQEKDLSTAAVVRPDGRISLPLVNEIDAAGKTVVELQKEITARLGQFVSNPKVNVILKEVRFPKFSVVGQVRKPDQYRIVNRVSLLDAIALAGGFTDFAKRDDVIVIRHTPSGGTQRIKLNVKRLVDDEKAQMFYLQQYDTVYVK